MLPALLASMSCFRASVALSGPAFIQPNTCRRGKATAAATVIQAPQELGCSAAQRNRIDEHVTLTLRHAGSVLWRLAPARVSHRSFIQRQMAAGITGPQSRRALSPAPPTAATAALPRHRTFKTSSAARLLFYTFVRPLRYKKKSLRVREAARLQWLLGICTG